MTENDIVGWIGDTAATMDWMEEEWRIIRICFNGAVSDSVRHRFRTAFPRLLEAGVDCQAGTWITLGTFTETVARDLMDELKTLCPDAALDAKDAADA